MKPKIRQQLANRKRGIARRLDKTNVPNCQRPMFSASDIHYEIADRTRGISSGGIGALHALAREKQINAATVQRAVKDLGINPEKPNPASS